MSGLNAVQAMTAILIRKQRDEQAKKEADERAAADAERIRIEADRKEQARRELLKKTSTVNAIELRQNWLQSMTTPFLKKQAIRARIAAQNKSMKNKARNRGKL